MEDLNYSFGMDLGDVNDAAVKEQREREAALEQIAALILKYGFNTSEIQSAISES